MDYRIETYPSFTVVGMKMRAEKGNKEIPGLWEKFVPRMEEVPHRDGSGNAYGVMGNYDPTTWQFDYLAGLPVSKVEDIPAGMERWDIPEQTYAVFSCTLQNIGVTFDVIYQEWLPASPYTGSNGPAFERYDKNFCPAEGKFNLTIWIPIRARVGNDATP